MSFSSTVDEVESVVYLPTVLKILGAAVLAITVWKGVHHFWPTAGLILGAVVLIAASFIAQQFSKKPSGDAMDRAIREQLLFLPALLRVVGILILAVTTWKGVHGFLPTTGVIVGGAMLLVGGMFNKIYK